MRVQPLRRRADRIAIVSSGTDWQRAGVTGETVTVTVGEGLVKALAQGMNGSTKTCAVSVKPMRAVEHTRGSVARGSGPV
jgi:hypothetical protein